MAFDIANHCRQHGPDATCLGAELQSISIQLIKCRFNQSALRPPGIEHLPRRIHAALLLELYDYHHLFRPVYSTRMPRVRFGLAQNFV
jgi:hypothetical protein